MEKKNCLFYSTVKTLLQIIATTVIRFQNFWSYGEAFDTLDVLKLFNQMVSLELYTRSNYTLIMNIIFHGPTMHSSMISMKSFLLFGAYTHVLLDRK